MHYLTKSEIHQFHDDLLKMMLKHSKSTSEDTWGYPGGYVDCDTFSFGTSLGTLLMGHYQFPEQTKGWWIPLALEENQANNLLYIAFEMSVPGDPLNNRMSVHYRVDHDGSIVILHKGKFTVGHGSLSMADFFEYYQQNPGRWPIVSDSGTRYLELGRINPKSFEVDFLNLIPSLAGFAKYLPQFKDQYR